MMATTNETTNNSSLVAIEETIYVAVGKDVDKSRLTLSWAVQKFHGKKFCILHVHQPSKLINMIRGDSQERTLKENVEWAIRMDKKILQKVLDAYVLICHQTGVCSEKIGIEMDDTGEGIVELVNQNSIKKLVMGAAADEYYSEGMNYIKSGKAKYVFKHVPLSCKIWFICGGHLIHSRKGGSDDTADEVTSASLRASSIFKREQLNPHRSSSDFTCSSSELDKHFAFNKYGKMEGTECWLDNLHLLHPSDEMGGSSYNQVLDQLEHSLVEAEKLKREAFEESLRRVKAEKNAIQAIRKARALERSYIEELQHGEEIKEVLAKEKQDHAIMKKQWDEARLIASDQRVLLDSQVASCEYMMKNLIEQRLSAVELSQVYKNERDMFQLELDNALELSKEVLRNQVETSSSTNNIHQFFSVFASSEIYEAICNFQPSVTIGEGGYRGIYKGVLHYTPVAIKFLNPDSLQGRAKFQREVDVLSKIRHPNLINLIGVSPEACALIYEYLPNGSLQDRLSCKDNSPPLSWQTRIRIATDICSALIFLHSCKPHGIVHGDLKAENVLLDANFVCKLGDFGICYYPQLPETEELSPKSDIYLFGIIILQLLIGRSPLNTEIERWRVLDDGSLEDLLDTSDGDWPFVQAMQLAHLALRCCDTDPTSRPDLVAEVWRVLVPMRASCGASSSFWLGSEERSQPPSHFICPILQEVMQDPHVAADGFTYEKEALVGWLESGHDTSPMTNLKLTHHNLVPNLSLRSAIQEWLQNYSK